MKKLPSFIIIGVMKCGTSGLYHSMTEHPKIQPAIRKELRFWGIYSKYHRGMEYYKGMFNDCKKDEITGEASPSYILYPDTIARRMLKDIPDVQLIVLLRNPITRAYSQFHHYLIMCKRANQKPITTNFDKFLEKYMAKTIKKKLNWMGTHLLERGEYAEQLKKWFIYFPKRKVKVVKSEDYFNNPQKVLNEMFELLNLSPYKVKTIVNRNKAKYSDSQTSQSKKILKKYYKPYNQELYRLLDRDFGWENEV